MYPYYLSFLVLPLCHDLHSHAGCKHVPSLTQPDTHICSGCSLPASRFRPVVGSLNDSNTKILANSVWGVNTWSPQCVSITASATSADWLNPLSQVSLVAGRIGWVAHAASTGVVHSCAACVP